MEHTCHGQRPGQTADCDACVSDLEYQRAALARDASEHRRHHVAALARDLLVSWGPPDDIEHHTDKDDAAWVDAVWSIAAEHVRRERGE